MEQGTMISSSLVIWSNDSAPLGSLDENLITVLFVDEKSDSHWGWLCGP
jgi:hypothetical protein